MNGNLITRFCGIAVLMALSCMKSAGQQKDTVQLQEVIVSDKNSQESQWHRQFYDSSSAGLLWAGSLSDAVRRNTGAYVRTYGPGSLSSLNYRGMSPSQVVVKYGDIAINSIMNGQADLNLVPLSLGDEVSIISGIMPASGSGSLGGEIRIENHEVFKKNLQTTLAFEGGSFYNFKVLTGFKGGTTKFQIKTRLLYNKARNDYTFRNLGIAGKPEQKQDHAASLIIGGIQEFSWKINQQNSIRAFGMATAGNRELPPTMLSVNQKEHQYDRLGIAALQWKFIKKKHQVTTTANYKREYIRYTNELIQIDDTSKADSWILTTDYHLFAYPKLDFKIRFESHNQQAFTDNYEHTHFRTINGLTLTTVYNPLQLLSARLILTQNLDGKKLTPFLPALSISIFPFKDDRLTLIGTISRNYRLPTINDLYWSPGGNPDLNSEKSWNCEGSIKWKQKLSESVLLSASAAGYWINVTNKILWQPLTTTIWSPVNIATVVSKGFEFFTVINFSKGNWEISFSGNYHFNKALDISGGYTNGNQLIYSPNHLANLNMKVSFKNYALSYHHHFTGVRFSDAENTRPVNAFNTGELTLSGWISFSKHTLLLYFRIENLWNQEYQNIAWRPMPGRGFFAGIKYEFSKQ